MSPSAAQLDLLSSMLHHVRWMFRTTSQMAFRSAVSAFWGPTCSQVCSDRGRRTAFNNRCQALRVVSTGINNQRAVLQIRTDKNLEYMRGSPKFEQTMKEYDQGIINEEAINAIKGLFGWGKKK